MGPRGRFYPYLHHCDYIGLFGTGFIQVMSLGRAPRTKETLPDFLKWHRVTRHPLVFRGLTGSQRTPGFGVSHRLPLSSNLHDEFYLRCPFVYYIHYSDCKKKGGRKHTIKSRLIDRPFLTPCKLMTKNKVQYCIRTL